jgi:hypothetical protein
MSAEMIAYLASAFAAGFAAGMLIDKVIYFVTKRD